MSEHQPTQPPTSGSPGSDIATLQHVIIELQYENQALKEQILQVSRVEADLMARMATLEGRSEEPALRGEPPVALPEKFNGDRRSYRGFMNQVQLVFQVNPSKYSTDGIKIAFVGTLLSGKALAWFSPYLENQDKHASMLSDFSSFKREMDNAFGDPDRSLMAAVELRKLHQGSKGCATYAADFRQLAMDLKWDDGALMHQFHSGLNPEVKDMLIYASEPLNTLDELIALAVKCDNRLFLHRQEMAASNQNRVAPKPKPKPSIQQAKPYSPPRVVSHSYSDQPPGIAHKAAPMEIGSSTRRAPLTEAEKQYRRDNNLCLYCGSQSHDLPKCPIKPGIRVVLEQSDPQDDHDPKN
jgi:hypothetical protein